MTGKIYNFVFLLAVVAISASCNYNRSTKSEQPQTIDMHNAQNSLDWDGTYSGNLPCADCESIKTVLILDRNLTYVLISQYTGKDKSKSDTIRGNFTWQGNNIKLDGISQNERPDMFKVEENRVRQLDMDGKEITGDLAQKYILTKTGNLNSEERKLQK